ncbi:MAG: hypothetical protein AAF206_26660, partial [Bacteroidota bacterium]
MHKHLIFCLACLCSFTSLKAERVLQGFDFETGDWVMIGVPLHNYQKLPMQEDLRTFITRDRQFLTEIKNAWDLERTFADKCDYHYALKLYKSGILIKTINVNLYCGYLTIGGTSYAFDPTEFDRFTNHGNPISWSRISFGDITKLKSAINKLEAAPNVYWYEDVEQYKYEGYFMLQFNGLPWNTDRDSLMQVVGSKIQQVSGTSAFHLQKYFYIVRGAKVSVSYLVNCDPDLATEMAR